MLTRLSITGVRNLVGPTFELGSAGNLFFGDNGSGKTSILEAVHLLSVGRSFRAQSARSVISFNEDRCVVSAKLRLEKRETALGIERGRDGSAKARVNGGAAESLSELAALLPLVLMDADSLGLITGLPEARRRFPDQCVFHVEQSFLPQWRRYQRALKQRNAGLRHGTLGAYDPWLDEVVAAGELITAARERSLALVSERFSEFAGRLSEDVAGVSIRLRCGWDKSLGLREALEKSLLSDQTQGFTHVGPHRADLRVSCEGKPASEVMSRGQLKLTVAALKLAQGRLLADLGRVRPVYLVDDLAAELDARHLSRVCAALQDSGAQTLLTAVDRQSLAQFWPDSALKMFHVEQGKVEALPVCVE